MILIKNGRVVDAKSNTDGIRKRCPGKQRSQDKDHRKSGR